MPPKENLRKKEPLDEEEAKEIMLDAIKQAFDDWAEKQPQAAATTKTTLFIMDRYGPDKIMNRPEVKRMAFGQGLTTKFTDILAWFDQEPTEIGALSKYYRQLIFGYIARYVALVDFHPSCAWDKDAPHYWTSCYRFFHMMLQWQGKIWVKANMDHLQLEFL